MYPTLLFCGVWTALNRRLLCTKPYKYHMTLSMVCLMILDWASQWAHAARKMFCRVCSGIRIRKISREKGYKELFVDVEAWQHQSVRIWVKLIGYARWVEGQRAYLRGDRASSNSYQVLGTAAPHPSASAAYWICTYMFSLPRLTFSYHRNYLTAWRRKWPL